MPEDAQISSVHAHAPGDDAGIETEPESIAAEPADASSEPGIAVPASDAAAIPSGEPPDGSNGGNEPSNASTAQTSPAPDALPPAAPGSAPMPPTPSPQVQAQPQQTPPASAPAGFISAMPPAETEKTALHAKALQARQAKKRVKLDKIMSALTESGRITNKDVCQLLRVSPATATRYLDALQNAGRLRQTGQRGRSAYILVPQ